MGGQGGSERPEAGAAAFEAGRGIVVAGAVGTAFARYRVGERRADSDSVVHYQADSKASAAPPMAERAATRSLPVASGHPHRRRQRRNQYVE